MDELTRLRDFRPVTVTPPVARADAARALNAAMTGRARRAFGPIWIVAFVGAAVLATAAYAVVREVVIGAPATPSVKHVIQHSDACPRGLPLLAQCRRPPIGIANATAGAAISTPVGPVYLWVAPTIAANGTKATCEYLQVVAMDLPGGRPNMSRECVPDDRVSVGIQGVLVRGQWLSLLNGRVGVTGAHTLVVHFTNGTTRTYVLRTPYVLADIGGSATTMPSIASTTVLNAKGRVLTETRRRDALSPSALIARRSHLQSELGQLRVVATARLIGTNYLLVEKGDSERECKEIASPIHVPQAAKLFRGQTRVKLPVGGKTLTTDSGGCELKPLGPAALNIGPMEVGGKAPYGYYVLFWGPVGVEIHTLALYFQNGTHVQIPIHHGYILYQVSPRNYVSGRRPTRVVGRNASGQVVSTRVLRFGTPSRRGRIP